MKKSIIFDLDGTLINSDPITITALNEIRIEEGLQPLEKDAIRPYLAMGGLSLIENTLTDTNSTIENTKYLERLRQKIHEKKVDVDLLFPNVKFALRKLVNNNLSLCICTNKSNALTRKILSELEISSFFKNIIADGDLVTRKPHVSNFLACTHGLELEKSEYLIIGDSFVDLELAKNSGVDFLAYANKENDKFIEKLNGKTFECYRDLVNSVFPQQWDTELS